MDLDTWDKLIRDLFLYCGKLLTLLNRRESKFRRELRQRRGDPVGSLIGNPGDTPVPGQHVITLQEWQGPFPQSPTPACTGPP